MTGNEWSGTAPGADCRLTVSEIDDDILMSSFEGYFHSEESSSLINFHNDVIDPLIGRKGKHYVIYNFAEYGGLSSQVRKDLSSWLTTQTDEIHFLACIGLDFTVPGTVNLCGALFAAVERVYLADDREEAMTLVKADRRGVAVRDEELESERRKQFQVVLATFYWGRQSAFSLPDLPNSDPYRNLYEATRQFLKHHTPGQIDPPEEGAQKEEQHRWKAVFEQSNDAILVFYWDMIIDCNKTMFDMFGYTREEMVEHSIFEFLSPRQPDGQDSVEKAREIFASILQTGEAQHYYWQHQRKDGALFDTHVTLNILWVGYDRFGMAIIRDISELMDAQRKIREQKDRIYRQEIEIEEQRRERLEAELEHKRRELVSKAMHMTQMREMMVDLANILNRQEVDVDQTEGIRRRVVSYLEREHEWEEFEKWFVDVHEDFLVNLRKSHSEISPQEEKICAFLRLNLNTKEIASIMNLSVKTVEVYRTNIRKKLNLSQGENLVKYISGV